MLAIKINDCNKTVIVSYPAITKKKPVTIQIRNRQDADFIYRVRTMKFICAEIRAFVNMRKFYFQYVGKAGQETMRAIQRLEFITNTYSEGSLERLCKHVANSRVAFSTLAPVRKSPALTHFVSRIVPIIKYCSGMYHQQTSVSR